MPAPAHVTSSRNWSDIRNAYINRDLQPSLDELAEEFGSTPHKISKMSVAESWPLARAARLEKIIDLTETSLALAHAVAGERTIQDAAKTAALGILRELSALGEELAERRASESPAEKKKGDRVRAGTLNDMSFALANVSKTMRDLGITGVASKLDGLGRSGSGAGGKSGSGAAWSPSMLSQINLTVQNLSAAPSAGAGAGAPNVATPIPPIPPSAPAASASSAASIEIVDSRDSRAEGFAAGDAGLAGPSEPAPIPRPSSAPSPAL